MKVSDVLSADRDVVSGAIVFRGSRVPLDAFFENISIEEFLENYPTIEREQAEAVLMLARRSLGNLPAARLPRDTSAIMPDELLLRSLIRELLGRSVRKASNNFCQWTGGKSLFDAGVESVMEAQAASDLYEALTQFTEAVVHLQFPTSQLSPLGLEVLTPMRSGRIDMVCHLPLRDTLVVVVEFKRFLAPNNIASDIARLGGIISAVRPGRTKAVGYLAGPMYQASGKSYDFKANYDANLDAVRSSWGSMAISADVSDNEPFSMSNRYDAHLSVVIEVAAKA